jgi:hypothetical protein
MMGFFHFKASRESAVQRQQHAGRVRDDKPADKIVQKLFIEIRRRGPMERRAWIKLAEYLARQGSARPADLMRP